ncbi:MULTISPECIES: sarcosine oxidase subunit alpha family protein [Mesorhizobium]|uniref:Sarcosine oxidase subunit alpha family protein n=4 Tax=Mesorhizobium TaxID=68287 RepID=A0ABZ0VHJ3_9HYPH|nr:MULTISPECIES: sarcosine oxidase subunit alpha family protein [Mesorhizobium]MBZ9909388.1 sarcosine oxidase subunit alpha family protein [Mesorhizobium sp. BR115XR7A]QGX80648.1 sarcosine oxidase subunit alpha family protein [Mesorhizobium japonicum R7A]QJF04791.1 sarcosine oxidase subunit alpha family protein [Mesorhizobium japonicum R7A]QJF10860.1 sarcosine oxidase subunit alpha family protein [Mesorhizobium japonicum]QJI86733.1 sarcosine oxidase subunit alpha family protein [Mesorhizobium 
MTSYRLPKGGLIDRQSRLGFSFDGQSVTGHAGDTLASALLANGRQLVGRSFKYHRPRGILTAGAAEPNALMTIGSGGRTEANTRATMQDLYDGLEARSQNRWPSLDFDIGSLNGLLSPFLAAGFYYKTFMWPAKLWEGLYEPFIRRAAGLGKATYEADPDRYEKRWAHCDLLVIGAGPAGLAAALSAGRAGARVIILDEHSLAGGSLLSEAATIGGESAPAFAKRLADELETLPNVRVLTRTTAFGWYDGNVVGAVERAQKHVRHPDPNKPVERMWRIVAKKALLATGTEERPLVFGGNDIPGVMIAGAMRCYLNRFAVAPGQRTAIFTTNDSGYALARDLEAAGVQLTAIIDSRAESQFVYTGKARLLKGAVVSDAKGGKALSSVNVTAANGATEAIAVDALAMSGGFSPIIHLACHRGGKPQWSDVHGAFMAPSETRGLVLAGAVTGTTGLSASFAEGAARGATMAQDLGFAAQPFDAGPVDGDIVASPASPLWNIRGVKGKAFVDFQNDVGRKDLGLAVQEGYGDVELAKRYTTSGMATDQGKLSNVTAIGLLAEARGVSPAEVGTTTFRPFYTPISFGALTGPHHGHHFQPVRKSPLHDWAKKHGAVFVETGLWYRSSWFPRAGETSWRQSVDREVLNVRTNVGICDVSMLGKIEVCGKDAAEFLNRVYSNAFLKLPVGKARYGLMLREDGFIYDDGTTSRLADDRFFMTTTTAYAAGVMTHLEFCAQGLWPELDVRLASVTDQWGQMSVVGPKARATLQAIVDGDISDTAFPFLAAKEVSLFGGRLHGRLFRISFSGELAYELAVPAGYCESVADGVLQAGKEHGIQPYGVEALSVLRIEKGHVTHNEINGTVIPSDLGFAKMVSTAKPDFIGKAMLGREGLVAQDRPSLVGVVPLDPTTTFRTGSHILAKGAAQTLENDQGYVSSSAFSPHVGSTIGLALVKSGHARHGEEVVVWNGLSKEFTVARLCNPVFFDPANEKLHV